MEEKSLDEAPQIFESFTPASELFPYRIQTLGFG